MIVCVSVDDFFFRLRNSVLCAAFDFAFYTLGHTLLVTRSRRGRFTCTLYVDIYGRTCVSV